MEFNNSEGRGKCSTIEDDLLDDSERGDGGEDGNAGRAEGGPLASSDNKLLA